MSGSTLRGGPFCFSGPVGRSACALALARGSAARSSVAPGSRARRRRPRRSMGCETDVRRCASMTPRGVAAGSHRERHAAWCRTARHCRCRRSTPSTVAVDLLYQPVATPLQTQVRAAGGAAFGGLGLLLHQAGLAIELWTGPAGADGRDVCGGAGGRSLRTSDPVGPPIPGCGWFSAAASRRS